MAPSAHVAKSDHFISTNSKAFSVGIPLNRSDNLIVSGRAVELSSETVPDSILTVFSSRDDSVVSWTPVTMKNDSIMSFPVNHFLAGDRRLNVEILTRAVKNLIVRTPHNTVDGVRPIDEGGSIDSTLTPELDKPVLTSSCESSAIITPFDRNDSSSMSF